jgi:hypothetical protein
VNQSQIAVSTPRSWVGDQRLGTFVLYLDRKRVGALAPQGAVRLSCSAGKHELIARQWWYRSRPFKFDLASDQELRLVVDLVREGSLPRRILFLMVMPWRGVVVKAAA